MRLRATSKACSVEAAKRAAVDAAISAGGNVQIQHEEPSPAARNDRELTAREIVSAAMAAYDAVRHYEAYFHLEPFLKAFGEDQEQDEENPKATDADKVYCRAVEYMLHRGFDVEPGEVFSFIVKLLIEGEQPEDDNDDAHIKPFPGAQPIIFAELPLKEQGREMAFCAAASSWVSLLHIMSQAEADGTKLG